VLEEELRIERARYRSSLEGVAHQLLALADELLRICSPDVGNVGSKSPAATSVGVRSGAGVGGDLGDE